MKMAKASEEDIENLRRFLEELEETKPWNSLAMAAVVSKHLHEIHGWRRVVEGYEVLFENCCDPTLDYLDFKPELKK